MGSLVPATHLAAFTSFARAAFRAGRKATLLLFSVVMLLASAQGSSKPPLASNESQRLSRGSENSAAPVPTSAVSRKTHGAAGTFDINLPLVPLGGPVGIENRVGATAGEHQMVVTFSGPVTVGGVSVTSGTGSATFSVAGAVVTEAIDVIDSGKPKTLEFGVADETAWKVGLSCGGTIRVFVEKVD